MKISVTTTFVCLSVLAAAATAQTTPAPIPAATTAAPIKYDPVKDCWSISVEHDATYCIAGPICSGSGAQPAGWNCPKKGDVATERCLSYLASWVPASESCVAPVDAECKVIKTGAWGCVLKDDTTSVPTTPAPTETGDNSTANYTVPTKPDNGTIQVPTQLVSLSAAVSTTSAAVGTIAVVAGVAAVAVAAIGTVLYKKNQKKTADTDGEQDIAGVVDVVTP
jgi:hypothetical protein